MKKLLLGTTALLGAAAVFANAAVAETPKVSVGGYADFQVGFQSVDSAYDANERSHAFQNETKIDLKVDGVSDSGLGYGAVIRLNADVSADADGYSSDAERTYLYLQGGWGRFEMGSNVGVTKTMRVDAGTLARATGGINGDWYDFVDFPSAANGQNYAFTTDLFTDAGVYNNTTRNVTPEAANKITYYSPRFSGFQLGLSYTPDTGEIGQVVPGSVFSEINGAGTNSENVFGAGVNYQGQFQDIGVALSATGEFGSAEEAVATQREDLRSYALGGMLTWRGFSFGGSWGTWEESLVLSPANNTETDFWNLGAAYDFGPFGASITYLSSDNEAAGADYEFNNLVIGADYMLAPGLVPYVEVSFFEFDEPTTGAADNDGTIFLIGTELSF